jgi:PTS system mannose-specific IID component
MSNAVMNKKELSKKDLVKAWALVYSSETCYNYERLQALGNTNMMMSVVKKLYDTKEEQVEALKTYMEFFNTEPSWIGTVIHGITVSMEEQKANGADISGEDINALRTELGRDTDKSLSVFTQIKHALAAGGCISDFGRYLL